MLRGRVRTLRAQADAYVAQLHDRTAKELVTGNVIYQLDAIEEFWLADRVAWPEFDVVWLNSAESMLGRAEESLANFEKLFSKYAGV
jgi:hypothetical protein